MSDQDDRPLHVTVEIDTTRLGLVVLALLAALPWAMLLGVSVVAFVGAVS